MDLLSEYRQNGFVLFKGLFDKTEVDLIRDQAKDIFGLQMMRLGILPALRVSERKFEEGMFQLFERDLQTFTQCGKHAQHLVSLHRLALDSRITEVLAQLGLEFPNICTRPVLYFNSERLAKKPVYWKLSAHQDWRSMQGSLDAVIVWLPLVEIDQALGALEVIPGSHALGLLKAAMIDGYGNLLEPVDTSSAVPIQVERGDALFFSAFLVHQSGVNLTDSIRWSCHFRFNNMSDPTFIERGFPHPYIYKPIEELITADFPTKSMIHELFAVE